ncbi:MAG: nucleotide exchange factor GrpE [Anaerolineales bacterium]|nr:nucleotide exchange factor GrpE [Anaerolineales bacterium]
MAEKEKNPEEEIIDGEGDENVEMTITTGEYNALQDQIQAAQDEAATNLDGWQRAQAEFANYKKRMQREQAQFLQDTKGRIIKRYLDVLDDLDRALKNRPTEGEGEQWATGIELIYQKFMNILENEGVAVMDAEGQMFDPNYHEAISQEDSPDHESGQIIEVIQQGYLLGDRVLRPALVRVAS